MWSGSTPAIRPEDQAKRPNALALKARKPVLFREVHWTVPVAQLVGETPGQTADNLVQGMLTAWARDPDNPMAILVRASMTSEDAATILRDHVTGHIITSIALSLTDDAEARLRAALLNAVMMGICQLAVPAEDARSARRRRPHILRLLSPALQALMNAQSPPAKPTRERKR